MNVPADLKYTKEHEWIKVEGGTATVGITEFAQSELGEIVFCEPPKTGQQVKAGDSVCVLESTKAASDVYSPISGKVSEFNESLKDNPKLINDDPYSRGWLFKLEAFNEVELGGLLSADEYKKLVG